MGCVASKGGAPVTPALDSSRGVSGKLEISGEFNPPSLLWNEHRLGNSEFKDQTESTESGKMSSASNSSVRFQLRSLSRSTEGEQVAAGWPAWLSANAGEAIQGWLPLKAESFEKLEKVGQGTYSSVFRASEIDTGRIVALKKVRFDNFEPESVRFMAREILTLRKLDHPNIIKLQGIITSRLSCSIYLVFEYMEHDLAGLSSSSDIKFDEPQIKCYMKQLLTGLEQCHSHGIIHRDIKCANLLVNNEGILKIADFGLANIVNPAEKQPLTSRVVTLWYRPPELLLGSTDYDASVDLWSIGCVFAELFVGKPILQARTEVEQIHKIFKLCGSPSGEFWKKTTLPHATVFKSQQPYENCLQTTFDFLPESAFKLLETLLSIEPDKRGTASTALTSEILHNVTIYRLGLRSKNKVSAKLLGKAVYFLASLLDMEIDKLQHCSLTMVVNEADVISLTKGSCSEDIVDEHYFWTKPYACEPSSLPKYQPNKEIDAKFRQDSHRSVNGRFFVEEACKRPLRSRRHSQESNGLQKTISRNSQGTKIVGTKEILEVYAGARLSFDQQPEPAILSRDERHVKQTSQGVHLSGPLAVPGSTGFAYSNRLNEYHQHIKSNSRTRSRRENLGMQDPLNISRAKNTLNLNGEENAKVQKPYDSAKDAMLKRWIHPELHDSLYSFDSYNSRDAQLSKTGILGYKDKGEKVEYSGPLLLKSKKVDEFLEKHEQHVRRAVRKSWFQRGQRQGL